MTGWEWLGLGVLVLVLAPIILFCVFIFGLFFSPFLMFYADDGRMFLLSGIYCAVCWAIALHLGNKRGAA